MATNSQTSNDDRVRRRAHDLWKAEGRPDGRAEAHWTMAREIVATEDSFGTTLLPLPDDATSEPVEPAVALENQGEFPGLADQGDETARAPRRQMAKREA